MNEVKISVIVPIFNSEEYLARCLDSIINQSYRNLEIILVNDGSTDSSMSIIEKVESMDNRVLVINKENGGIGSAYRIALGMATGDYLSFVDSDDYIALSMYEELIRIIEDNKPDIIHFGTVLINENGIRAIAHRTFNLTIDGTDNILNHHFTSLKFPGLGCRIFKKHLFSKVEFFNQNIGIDEMTIVQILVRCSRAVYISKVFYYAEERIESVSRITYSRKKINESIRVYRFLCDYLEKANERYAPYIYIKYLTFIILVCSQIGIKAELAESVELSKMINDISLYCTKVKKNSIFKKEQWRFKFRVRILAISPQLFFFYSSVVRSIKNVVV